MSAWFSQDNPFRVSTQEKGNFEIMIRAFDKAGNFKEELIQINVISPLMVITKGGVQIKGILFPYWFFYILVGIILFCLIYLILRWIKIRKQTLKEKFLKEIKEAEKEIEDVKKFRENIEEIKELREKSKREEERLREDLWEE